MSVKILAIGREVSDFMSPVFAGLKTKYGLQCDLLELRGRDKVRKSAFNSFSNVLDVSLKISSYSKSFVLSSVFSTYFVKQLLASGSVKTSVRQAVYYKRFKPVLEGYDVVSIQFITPEFFEIFDAVAAAKKISITFWGSDLLHNNEDFKYEQQSKLIALASSVTVHHKEMLDVFLSKFGRKYATIAHTVLPVSDAEHLVKFSALAKDRLKFIQSFKERHDIPANKRIVVVGHSAHALDNHAAIAEALMVIQQELREQVCFVLPMTYGAHSEQYYTDVEQAYKKLGAQYIILRDFLSMDEILELRAASEVLIRLSDMDAFSWALSETLCAGNVVIAGAWLPYGKLTGNNVVMQELYEIKDVAKKLLYVLANYDDLQAACVDNPVNTFNVFAEEQTVDKFYKILTNE